VALKASGGGGAASRGAGGDGGAGSTVRVRGGTGDRGAVFRERSCFDHSVVRPDVAAAVRPRQFWGHVDGCARDIGAHACQRGKQSGCQSTSSHASEIVP
jgi:hypothetical protein